MSDKIIKYELKLKNELKRSIMPFLKNGGLFVRTDDGYQLGDVVTVELTLFDKSPLVFTGEIVWITPKGGSDIYLNPGVGVEFPGDRATELKKVIERILGDSFKGLGLSYTMEG